MRIIQTTRFHKTMIITRNPKFKLFRALKARRGTRKSDLILHVYSKRDYQEITGLLETNRIKYTEGGYGNLSCEYKVFSIKDIFPDITPPACSIYLIIRNSRIKEIIGKIKNLGYLNLMLSPKTGLRILR